MTAVSIELMVASYSSSCGMINLQIGVLATGQYDAAGPLWSHPSPSSPLPPAPFPPG